MLQKANNALGQGMKRLSNSTGDQYITSSMRIQNPCHFSLHGVTAIASLILTSTSLLKSYSSHLLPYYPALRSSTG